MKCILRPRLGQTRSSPRLRRLSFARRIAAPLLLLAVALAGASAARTILRARQDRLHLKTGSALWIWWRHDLPQPSPLFFYAVKSFPLATAPVPARARVFVDRTWELFVNGRRISAGDQKPGDPLADVDLTGMLHPGSNTIVITAGSPTGAGGILFALDLGTRANAIVSDASWRVTQSESEARAGRGKPAVVWGKPPMHPWGYP